MSTRQLGLGHRLKATGYASRVRIHRKRGNLVQLFKQVDQLISRLDAVVELSDVRGQFELNRGQFRPPRVLYADGSFDLVCGSRYMKGGQLIGGPFFKQLMSRTSGLTLHYLRGVPTHDATNSFKLYDAAMVRELKVESVAGFELGLELTVKAFLNGYRIAEIPSVWRDRTAGTSRFRVLHWLPHYLKWYFHAFRRRRATQRNAARASTSSENPHRTAERARL